MNDDSEIYFNGRFGVYYANTPGRADGTLRGWHFYNPNTHRWVFFVYEPGTNNLYFHFAWKRL